MINKIAHLGHRRVHRICFKLVFLNFIKYCADQIDLDYV